jgi:glycogen operon protein
LSVDGAPTDDVLGRAIEAGTPTPLGATPRAGGVNFAIGSSAAERLELCLYDGATGALRGRLALPARSGDTWHGFLPAPHASVGDLYAYRAQGPWAPERGLRFNPAKLLLDPSARALTGEPGEEATLLGTGAAAALDSAAAMPRCRIVDATFDWQGDRAPRTPWRDTILYELHVRGFSAQNPAVPEALRGTYLGLAAPASLAWLTELGVTALELLPCQAFTSEAFLRARGLTNYWGYNPIAWSAPATQYALADPVSEFQTMVRALHAAGIEVILDVVFNHTAEGDEQGPTLSLRGLDNAGYYYLPAEDPSRYVNWTGCGNTVAIEAPLARALVLDCLRWWVEAMHVDGFRFDLGPVLGRKGRSFDREAEFFAALRAEPSLRDVKLIAEPWDLGPDGYRLGDFPAGWSEWNDRYRDTVRAFWRGGAGLHAELAERLAGSSDVFNVRGRAPTASIAFVTAHDGFTLNDLVSYQERHNEANGEGNADGSSHNLSWNGGVEGPTERADLRALRARRMRNILLTLFVSQGVPMLQAGDELMRTQGGNNNAYCQDNALSWLNWSGGASADTQTRFTRQLIALRKRRPELRRDAFLTGTAAAGRAADVTWLHPAGHAMAAADWQDPGLRALGFRLAAAQGSEAGDLVILLNVRPEPIGFLLPAAGAGYGWQRILDTDAPDAGALHVPGATTRVGAESALVLEAHRA